MDLIQSVIAALIGLGILFPSTALDPPSGSCSPMSTRQRLERL
jgi:hypothetical protein